MPAVGASPQDLRHESGTHGIIPQAQDCTYPTINNDNNDQSRSPDIIEIDPNLTSAPQQPIPAFKGLNSSWLSDGSRTILSRMRQNNGPSFGSNIMQDLINPENVIDISLSPPDSGQSSDRPTPSSSTSHQNTNSGSRTATHASPESQSAQSTNDGATQQAQKDRLQNQWANNARGLFGSIGGTDLPRTLGAAETPKDGNSADANSEEVAVAVSEAFSWDSFGAGVTGGSAMTPMSESVLKTMLSMGPMETMEIFNSQTWTDNPSSGS